jgi:hypothetical protein
MSIDVPVALVIAAVVSSAMAAAASLDQSVKQLPTRRRIGVVAYSRYSLVADARNGLFWYVPLAIAWIPITVGAAITGWADRPSQLRALALAMVVLGVTAHLIVTGAFAGPALLSQRRVAGDEDALERVFDRFARWQILRAAIDVATLGAAVWALVLTMAERQT